jgi:hypothetical protein
MVLCNIVKPNNSGSWYSSPTVHSHLSPLGYLSLHVNNDYDVQRQHTNNGIGVKSKRHGLSDNNCLLGLWDNECCVRAACDNAVVQSCPHVLRCEGNIKSLGPNKHTKLSQVMLDAKSNLARSATSR